MSRAGYPKQFGISGWCVGGGSFRPATHQQCDILPSRGKHPHTEAGLL